MYPTLPKEDLFTAFEPLEVLAQAACTLLDAVAYILAAAYILATLGGLGEAS